MKNIVFTMILVFPVFILLFFMVSILGIDNQLVYVTKKTRSINNNFTKRVFIDKHSSKRSVYFFTENKKRIIKNSREYRGVITGWKVLLNNRKYENESQLSFYLFKNKKNDDNSIPFFSINNKDKNTAYYIDIFQYIKNNYFFFLLIIFLFYIFGSGWMIDYFGGISKHNIIGGFFVFNVFIFIILLFL
ncbi:hypothetical protein [Empedobacter sedimenti]|uniref:hypothetical protein n=1 Tax=Empedobacter sedimenti TaxID=3042610 RepID=UPI0024A73FE1|nr:hypothetical protein [Empedobacter sedimenti]